MGSPPPPSSRRSAGRVGAIRRLASGLVLVAVVAGAAAALALLQTRALGVTILDRLVLAILLGAAVRTTWTLPAALEPGVAFAATPLLEGAIVLLGAAVDLPLLVRAGPVLLIAIVGLVGIGLAVGYVIGRLLQLPPRLAALVATGNAICGNSAIAALAPVIGATTAEVTSAIAFTAVLGVGVVLGLPLLIVPLGLSDYQFGVLAGMSVYAVPQVLAATMPVSALAAQVGTLVKLVRVMMLGPVVVAISVIRTRRARRPAPDGAEAAARPSHPARPLPWFLLGFLGLAALRTAGMIPELIAGRLALASGLLTLVAMAGLGLGVDLRELRRAGPRVSIAAGLAMVALVMGGVLSIRLLRIA
ncbi:MAG: YeiH family protein [Gemmatimonadaceae bacterium]|jgi:uncharacterized integral membrane protein (TIGR00698 family)